MTSECRSCGAKLSAGAFLCPQCGLPVVKPQQQERAAEPTWGGLALPGKQSAAPKPAVSVPAPPKPAGVPPRPPAPNVSRPPATPSARPTAQFNSVDRLDAAGFVGGSVVNQELAVRTAAFHSQPSNAMSGDSEDELPAALGGFAPTAVAPPAPYAPPAPPAPYAPPRAPATFSAPPRTGAGPSIGPRASLGGLDLISPLEIDVPRDMAQRSLRPGAGRGSLSPAGSARMRGSFADDDMRGSLPAREPFSEVAAVARYGAIPTGLIGCAFYAIKVGLRRMEISATLTRLTAERGRAAAEADRALTTLGQTLYQRRNDPRLEALAPEIERVMAADQTLGERNAAHQDARWEVVDELATLDQVVADTSATIEPVREHETNLQRYLDQLTDNTRRTQARLQRVEIQIRALHSSEEMTDDPELLPTLEAERRVREQELRALADQTSQVRQALGEARRELAAHLGTLEALHEDRQGRQRALQQKDDIHKSYTGDAIDAMTYALRLLAHAALDQGHFMVAEPETRKAETAVQRLKDRDRDETLHRAAIDSYDTIAVRRGVFVLVVGFIGTLGVLRLIRHLGGHF